jgi:fructokinase
MIAAPGGNDDPVPGGAPYNFARALALRGIAAGYANPFSDDVFGQLLRRTLEASGARHLGAISSRPTSIARVTDEGGALNYAFTRDRVADRDLDAACLRDIMSTQDATGFHTGGLALMPPDASLAVEAMRACRQRGIPCTVDVNMRMGLAQDMQIGEAGYRTAVLQAVKAADIVKVSDEDLVHLGLAGDPVAQGRLLLTSTCRLVVLTRGAAGAWALTAGETLHQPAAEVRCVDAIGAGDCFFAGFVASLMHGGAWGSERALTSGALGDALRHATDCAAFTLARRGCQPPGLGDVPPE